MDTVLIPLRDVLQIVGDLCSDCQAKIRVAIMKTATAGPGDSVLNSIVTQVCNEANARPDDVRNGGNRKELVDLRAEIARRARLAGFSFPQIGRAMNRHHTSVMHLLKGRKS